MRYIPVLLLFTLFSFQPIAAQNALKKQIGDTLTVLANSNMWVGNITVRNLAINTKQGKIEVTTNETLGYLPFREENVEQIYGAIKAVLPTDYKGYSISCKVGNYYIENLIPNYFRSKKTDTNRQYKIENPSEPLVRNISLPYEVTKGMQGKHIAVWGSHGYYYNQEIARWEWQRPRLNQTVEDLYTTGYVLPFLVPMLENAGANVLLPRERDIQTHEVIVDNDQPTNGSAYVERNKKNPFQTSTDHGFANNKEFYIYGENPFNMGTYRFCETVTNENNASTIEWRPHIPKTGKYAVYISYKTVENSTTDALYTVYHAGGETRFKVNQTMYGSTWLYLGHFDFHEGNNQQGKVTLSNISDEKGGIVTADAVRFGGGMGNMARQPYIIDSLAMLMKPMPKNGKRQPSDILRTPSPYYTQETSDYPRFMEGARYWLQWAGAPDSIYSRTYGENDYSDDFQSRGFWVNYISGGSPVAPKEKGLKVPVDLAFAFHSDAGMTPNDSIIGTLGIFTTQNKEKKQTYANGTSRLSSRDLSDLIQHQIITDIRSAYAPEWICRGIWDKSFSESRVPEVPTMLLELLSHQNFADMRYGLDPRFRFTVCRAVYKGMLKYFESVYDEKFIIQPLPVKQFSAQFAGDNEIKLHWLPTDDPLEPDAEAKHYVVYTRIDEGGFDNGVLVRTNHYNTKIDTDKIYSFKIEAVNDGGKSFPSEILSVCRSSANQGEVLIVNGFDRVSAPVSFMQDTTYAGFLNKDDAGVPYLYDISFTGEQHEFRRDAPFISNDAPGMGASYGEYEKIIVAGNTFDYPYIHGKAIKEAGYSFISCSKMAVTNDFINLKDFKIVDLILGKQRETYIGNGKKAPEFQTFPLALQRKIEDYCGSGGNLMLSGAYFASDMYNSQDNVLNGKSFVENTLKCKLRSTKAALKGEVKTVASPVRAFQKSEFSYYNAPNSTAYYVESPDAIEPIDKKGYTICRYAENNLSAGIAYADGQNKICAFAFPFETIREEQERNNLMNSILKFLTGRR